MAALRIRAIETIPLRAQLPRVFRGSRYQMSTHGLYPIPQDPGFGVSLSQDRVERYAL